MTELLTEEVTFTPHETGRVVTAGLRRIADVEHRCCANYGPWHTTSARPRVWQTTPLNLDQYSLDECVDRVVYPCAQIAEDDIAAVFDRLTEMPAADPCEWGGVVIDGETFTATPEGEHICVWCLDDAPPTDGLIPPNGDPERADVTGRERARIVADETGLRTAWRGDQIAAAITDLTSSASRFNEAMVSSEAQT